MSETGKFWTTFILALIGALAWLPPTCASLKSSKIEGKILSQYANIAKLPNGQNGAIILQKLSIYSKNKNFYLKDIEVYLKVPDLKDELKCTLWTWRDLFFTFDENGRKVQKKLNIDSKEYLLHLSVLPTEAEGHAFTEAEGHTEAEGQTYKIHFIKYERKMRN